MGEYKYVAYMANMLYVLFLYSKIERRVINLDYVIKNPKNVFIQLNENGRPVTCTEENKGIFE